VALKVNLLPLKVNICQLAYASPAFSFINDDPFLRLFYITTDDASTPENTDKVIELATNKDDYADITDYKS
jgi:hypothetical protein